jgi:hypothetical protein
MELNWSSTKIILNHQQNTILTFFSTPLTQSFQFQHRAMVVVVEEAEVGVVATEGAI